MEIIRAEGHTLWHQRARVLKNLDNKFIYSFGGRQEAHVEGVLRLTPRQEGQHAQVKSNGVAGFWPVKETPSFFIQSLLVDEVSSKWVGVGVKGGRSVIHGGIYWLSLSWRRTGSL